MPLNGKNRGREAKGDPFGRERRSMGPPGLFVYHDAGKKPNTEDKRETRREKRRPGRRGEGNGVT